VARKVADAASNLADKIDCIPHYSHHDPYR